MIAYYSCSSCGKSLSRTEGGKWDKDCLCPECILANEQSDPFRSEENVHLVQTLVTAVGCLLALSLIVMIFYISRG